MRKALLALTAAVGLSGATPAMAADAVIAQQLMKLCVLTHGDPKKVLSAADMDGWAAPAPGQVDAGAMISSYKATARYKTVDGVDMTLTTGESADEYREGRLTRRMCSINGSRPNSPDIAASVSRLLGFEPELEAGVAHWSFLATGADMRRFDARENVLEGLRQAPLGAVSTQTTFSLQNLDYIEMELTPRL